MYEVKKYVDVVKRSWKLSEDIAIGLGVSDNAVVIEIFRKICPTVAIYTNNYNVRCAYKHLFRFYEGEK